MPRGASPGERRGGRTKGTPNKVTIAKAVEAERKLAEMRMKGIRPGLDIMRDFMTVFAGMAAKYQPREGNNSADEKKFYQWADLAFDAAAKVTEFESPKFRAIVVSPPPPPPKDPEQHRFTLAVFEGGKQIEHQPLAEPGKKSAAG